MGDESPCHRQHVLEDTKFNSSDGSKFLKKIFNDYAAVFYGTLPHY